MNKNLKLVREIEILFWVVEWLCALVKFQRVSHASKLDHQPKNNRGKDKNWGKEKLGMGVFVFGSEIRFEKVGFCVREWNKGLEMVIEGNFIRIWRWGMNINHYVL